MHQLSLFLLLLLLSCNGATVRIAHRVLQTSQCTPPAHGFLQAPARATDLSQFLIVIPTTVHRCIGTHTSFNNRNMPTSDHHRLDLVAAAHQARHSIPTIIITEAPIDNATAQLYNRTTTLVARLLSSPSTRKESWAAYEDIWDMWTIPADLRCASCRVEY